MNSAFRSPPRRGKRRPSTSSSPRWALSPSATLSTTAAATPIYNRVPKVAADFWLIKLMAVAMGETAADYLNVQIGLG